MILIDTNVISTLMAAKPNPSVRRWFSLTAAGEIHIPTPARAEIRFGLARLSAGKRKTELIAAAERVFEATAERMVSFDAMAADRYGEIVAQRQSIGAPISIVDAQIAAIGSVRRAIVATRNVKDFARCGVGIVNPFDETTWSVAT